MYLATGFSLFLLVGEEKKTAFLSTISGDTGSFGFKSELLVVLSEYFKMMFKFYRHQQKEEPMLFCSCCCYRFLIVSQIN